MNIRDRIYGPAEIREPVLLALIKSAPIQRLKNINQAGASKYILAGRTVSRYEHCVGVMILLKKLGAPIEEQIAGLLHDVSHTAFSHVADFVFKNKNFQNTFHEKFYKKIILQSSIPKILKKFGFNTARILKDDNFSLLERPLPDLCADRVDYTMRDSTAFWGKRRTTGEYIKNLAVVGNEIIFASKATAKKFATDFIRTDEASWSHPLEVAAHKILADAIKIALDKKIITVNDLFQDDQWVYAKLNKSRDKQIVEKLKMLNPKLKIRDNPDNFDFHARNKLRFVDPKYLDNRGHLHRVSETFKKFKGILTKHKQKIERGNFIKIVSY